MLLVLVLALGVTILTPLTTSAGEWLYNGEPQHSAILELHEQRGGWMIYFSLGLLVVAVVQTVQYWLESRSPDQPRKAFAVVAAVLAVVVGLTAIVGVVRIGHYDSRWNVARRIGEIRSYEHNSSLRLAKHRRVSGL